VGRSFVVIVFIFISFGVFGQSISPFGKFLTDSINIGERIQYSLSVKYPANYEVIFPDSTYDFAPFEFYSKTYFPTRIDSLHAIDSAVYTVGSFEIDLVQKLQLPIFIIDGKDSTTVLTAPDSVYFREMVVVVPDSLAFRENLAFQKVFYAFNYPYLLIGIGILLVIGALVYLVFGKSIRVKIKLYRLRKAYEQFCVDFERGINHIRQQETKKELLEEILVIWKRYMEKLEDRPFTKYTSKEILKAGYAIDLKLVLQNIDQSIYGFTDNEKMHKNFESLEDFTLERYQEKLNHVKNG